MSAEKVGAMPGPWIIRYGCIYGTVPDRDPEYICEPWGRGHAETQANMHLICAAPDLLALAKRYASECGTCGGTGVKLIWAANADHNEAWDHSEPCAACADLRAAIAKAEGSE